MGYDLASKHYGILLFIRFMLLCLYKDATDRRLALINSCNQKRSLSTRSKCSAVFFDGKIYSLNFKMKSNIFMEHHSAQSLYLLLF